MEPRECTITFIYPKNGTQYATEITQYQVHKVNYQKPYQYSKWLFTKLVDGHPYFSYQAENDEELFILLGKQSLNAVQINIKYND